MKQLKSIGVASVFKVSLILGAVAGLLIGIALMISDIIDQQIGEGLVTLILAPLLYSVLGACVNAFMAFIYNKVAERTGGVELDIE